jgi:putative ABC transport system substrate-binding protein
MPRLGVTALIVPLMFAAGSLPASHVSVLVVSESGVDAYREALDGVTAVLPAGDFRVLDAGDKAFENDFAGALEGGQARVVIAVGSRALAAVRAHRSAIPVVSAMALHAGGNEPGIRRVELDIPPGAQLAAMRSLWPGHTRAGIIRSPAQARYAVDALEAAARKEGFSLRIVDCDGPAHLLKALSELKGKVDFVLCLPDPDLYNAVTVKPLVLASLDQSLPLVGFSASFVRAGAAAGIFPDYGDLGQQSAELAMRMVRGEDRGAEPESPRKVHVAVNQRVARLLGVSFRADGLAEVFR